MTPTKSRLAALIVIDLVRDIFDPGHRLPIAEPAAAIITPINELAARFRAAGHPVVFSTDAFQPDDFFFSGRMAPHAVAGTPGAEPAVELDRRSTDYWLPKPRFSAFFKTGLEKWLRERGVSLCAVAGISTHFCVLATVFDALCHEFEAVLLEDCCAAFTAQIHQDTVDAYRRNPLSPLLRVMPAGQLAHELGMPETLRAE